jgi:hypothetical protein
MKGVIDQSLGQHLAKKYAKKEWIESVAFGNGEALAESPLDPYYYYIKNIL